MTLKVPKVLLERVHAESERAFPEEACGLFIGAIPDDFEKPGRAIGADEARPLPNGWESAERTRRYQIDPKLLIRTEKELEGTGKCVVGFYHSHPGVPAWPSPFDLERAWPCYSYWIVCVREGKAEDQRSWMRSEDGRNFIEEPIAEGD